MANLITCPKCNTSFDSSEHLKEKVTGFFSFIEVIAIHRLYQLFSNKTNKDVLDSSNTVVCPNCGFEFVDNEYKYFNVFSKSSMRKFIIIFIILFFIAFPLYILMKDLIK